jgi:signal transduction histidine kinase/ActR/RegA family two-component response regulator
MTRPDWTENARRGGTVLERRFMLSMAVVILALMGPAMVVVQFRAAEHFQESAQVRGASMARSIAAVATPALLAYNYVGLEDAARGASQDEGVAYVIIHDKEGLVAGDSRRRDYEARRSRDPISSAAVQAPEVLVQRARYNGPDGPIDVLDVSVPVYVANSSEKWGTVRVGISLEPVRQAVGRITWSLGALGLLGFVLCLLGARSASRKITAPLQTLREGTMALAQGDLTHRIEIATGDEIEDLAGHFNHMADEIAARAAEARDARGALENLNASLEQEVLQRTAALQGSESRYRALVEGAPLGIAIVQGGRVVYSNPAYQRLTAGDTRNPFELLDDEERTTLLGEMSEWSRSEVFGPREVRLVTKDNPARFATMRWMAVELEGEAADLCLLEDVTAVRKLQEQVVVSDKLRALGELASGVAHDFNNCLAIILGRCQLLALRSQDPAILQGLSIIEKAASDGGQTVRRIQDFARMRKETRRESIDVRELIEDVVEITRSKWKNEAQGKGLSIEVDTQFAHTATIDGNAAELREALTNLIINAVDAMPKGGRLSFRARDERVDERDMVRVEVSDTGQGIPREVQAQIFDPFFSTKGNLGTGLGLSITYGIVTRHGGTITVESVPDEGTTFVLRMPVGTATAGAGAAAADEEIPFVPATVLVVDDEPEIRDVLVEGLTNAGYKATPVGSGREAITRLGLVHYDVVLTDLGMPEVTGWDVVAAARTTRPEMILGLVTGWGETLDPAQVSESGVTFVIAKPFDVRRVVHDIRKAVLARSREAA